MFAMIGQWELILLVLALLLLFGGRKIPELARGLGSGVREFQQGLKNKGKLVDDVEVDDEEKDD
ncbi:MAG: twin-arginine translocase TatA/TatE family subunit [Candidatus Krumholzibacteria bacterium]|jgi:sec-independent protein translocase protein TatA|nr:twin-arginine translocase TatA/TatE family subunit [Candidatus Krumholzibacteria bacterium]MDP6670130.1 twin-arginine translocase TatA/TatE family subunit [Candidatus Krumholzibacteria bacterium]MDP6797282.1 twin-arginine translocase TatA/TatE family subunit [Candidatus Krumholzibacteria bacterium]MDP7020784.1 twin-arginine translocase TatA/TatE family subunit [Candidatus Krumholzibacteria bacterium]